MTIWKGVRNTLTAEMVSVTVGLVAGIGLAKATDRFAVVPGILVMVPTMLGMSNDIDGTLAARLGSALHTGVIEPRFTYNRELFNIIAASFLISLSESISVGILAHLLCVITGLGTAGLSRLVFVALVGGFIGEVISIPITTFFSIFLFSRGIDPDSVMGPILTSYGDILTVTGLYVATLLIDGKSVLRLVNDYMTIALISLFFLGLLYATRRRPRQVDREKSPSLYDVRKIIRESLPMIITLLAVTAPAGLFLGFFRESLFASPSLLLLLPPLNDMAGDFGCILCSRISSALYTGRIQPSFKGNSVLKEELITIFLVGVASSAYLGPASHVVSGMLSLESVGLIPLLGITLLTGTMLIPFEILVSLAASFISFSKGVDPDNVTIPIVTDVADVVGTGFLIASAMIMGVIIP